MTKSVKTDKELEKEYLELRDYIGHENLRIDLQQEVIQGNNSESIFIEESYVRYI